MRSYGTLLSLQLLATLLAFHAASAQRVTGKVVAKLDNAPVSGAIVALIDSSGRAVATKLAEDSGTFVLSAPAAGSYALRVDRVGFRSTITPAFSVRQSETIERLIAIADESVSLRAVEVSADRRCLVRPQEGFATAQLWNEARKALSATQLTALAQSATKARSDPHRFAVRWRKFRRELDAKSLMVTANAQVDLEGEAVTPFVAADPEMLARDGYSSGPLEGGSTFYAPDASVLLSERFLDTHCFRLQAPARDRRDDLIGLAFEPVGLTKDAKRVEVRGVLWLDRSSAELRYLEYGYVNLPVDADPNRAGGRLEFRPLPDGRWIVWRWYVRTPGLEKHRTFANNLPGDWEMSIVRVREDGAEILEVMPARPNGFNKAVVRGTVFDSLRGVALSGVRVFLSGTSFSAETGAEGRYEIASVPPGRYTVSMLTPLVDSLLIDPPSRDLSVRAGQELDIDLGIPTVQALASRLCNSSVADTTGMIVGVVRDTSGSKAPGASVRAEWQIAAARSPAPRPTMARLETHTTTGGRYAVCGVPRGAQLTVHATDGHGSVVSSVAPKPASAVRRVDLTLHAPRG